MVNKPKILIAILSILISFNLIICCQNVLAQQSQSYSKSSSNVTLLGQWVPNGPCEEVDIENDLLYTNNGNKLLIVNISDSLQPEILSETVLHTNTLRFIKVFNGYLYVSDGNTVRIIDVNNPRNPEEVTTYGNDQNFLDICFSGDYAYLVEYYSTVNDVDGLRIINIENPANPSDVKFLEIANPIQIELKENYIFLINNDYQGMFYVIDITTPAEATFSEFDLDVEFASSMCLDADRICILSNIAHKLYFIDISDPNNPDLIVAKDTEDHGLGTDIDLYCLYNNMLYYKCFYESVYSIGILNVEDPYSISVQNTFQTEDRALDFILIDNLAYIADETGGLRIYDISDINNINELGYIDKSIELNFEDIAVYDTYVYLLGYNEGMHILDISDKSNPQYANTIVLPDHSYCLKIKDEHAYIINNGLRIFDLTDPLNPNEIGYWEGSGYSDLVIKNELAFITSGNYFYIIDIGDKSNPQKISEYHSGAGSLDLEEFDVVGTTAFITHDYYHMSVTWSFESLDISDPENPKELGDYSGTWNYSSWTPNGDYSYKDVCIHDPYLYAAHSYGGVGVFDISEPANPAEVAFYHGNVFGLHIETNYAYILNKDVDQFQILNISDPSDPILAGHFDVDGDLIAVKDGISYIVSDNLYIIQNDLLTDISDGHTIPINYRLDQNHPNPFNPATTIPFSLKNGGHLKIDIYNIAGQRMATIVNGYYPAGNHEIDFDGSYLPSGIYIYKLQTKRFTKSRKMILLK